MTLDILYSVQVDLRRLRRNLSFSDGRGWSEDDVRKWLSEIGFDSAGPQQWTCREDCLYALTPEEIISSSPPCPFPD